MNKEEFLNHVIDQFDEVEDGEVQMETNFKELEEWSSMHALMIIGMSDKYYKVEVTGDDLKKCTSVDDLYQLINTRIA